MICEVMATKVTELCGFKHSPSFSDYCRACRWPVRIFVEGEREKVVRPRVRCKGKGSSSCEVKLVTYRVSMDPAQLQAQVIQAIVAGVSRRSCRIFSRSHHTSSSLSNAHPPYRIVANLVVDGKRIHAGQIL
jgi:hypothetical protein